MLKYETITSQYCEIKVTLREIYQLCTHTPLGSMIVSADLHSFDTHAAKAILNTLNNQLPYRFLWLSRRN